MTDETEDDVTIIAADTSLLRKFGKGNLDRLLSTEAITKAEKIIASASDAFYDDCLNEAARLQPLASELAKGGQAAELALKKLIATAFDLKTKSGQAGYDLIAALAKSLHCRCEEITAGQLTPTMLKLIDWHQSSINQMLVAKIKGDGGEVGKTILAEIEKLAVKS